MKINSNIMPDLITAEMTEKALGQNYFKNMSCPINLSRVSRKQNLSHDFDLTETEHFHDFIELVFIINGQGTQVLEDNEYLVSAGDVFVLQGNQRHFFKNAGSVEIINLMFDGLNRPDLITNKLHQLEGYKALFILEPHYRSNYRFKNMLHLDRNELANIEVILNTMLLEQEQKKEGYEIILINRLEELIILLSRHYSNIKTTKARALVRIGKVIDYMENNYPNNICIEELSEMSFMSTRNFMRIFQGAVGLSPINYLKQVRLQKARYLLRESNNQVAEISSLCGFTDSNYFIKCFRHAYGITPNKFRSRFQSSALPEVPASNYKTQYTIGNKL
jgi:AraC-like DNA-binding protein/mannose-6-phosphate isomerase-like protein (cupin superfamily)